MGEERFPSIFDSSDIVIHDIDPILYHRDKIEIKFIPLNLLTKDFSFLWD